MKLSADDPKITAYALDELEDAERAAIETALRDSPECRAAVEEIRATAGILANELAAEPCPELTPGQRTTIEPPAAAKVEPFPWWRVWRTTALTAAAACVAGVFVWVATRDTGPAQQRMAKTERFEAKPPSPIYGVAPAVQGVSGPGHSGGQPGPAPTPNGGGFTAAFHSGQPPGASPENRVTVTFNYATHASSDDADVTILNPLDTGVLMEDGKNFFKLQESPAPPAPAAPPSPTPQLAARVWDSGSGIDATYSASVNHAGQNPRIAAIGPEQAIPPRGNGGGVYSVNAVGNSPGYAFRNQNKSAYPKLNVSGGYGPSSLDSASVAHAQFTPDGRHIVTSSDDKTARIWYAQTGQPITHPITAYAPFIENAFVPVLQEPLSTFSIDVDTASYANVRRFLNSGQLPPRDAVRIEELVNYFTYAYPPPRGEDPFSASIETAGCPWTPGHRLVRVALKGREMPRDKRPPSNFVFLIDVSGSMQPAERLPLLKQALRQLVKKMTANDRVAIVVYASEAGIKLESTSCSDKEKILAVIDALEAGGSTNGGEGIQQAYATARRSFIKGGVNRVILCTDGDFNVGLTDQNALVALVKENAATGVFLTTLGVGTDNYKDALMQRLSDRGNGNYHYLDTLEEAQKVLIEQMNATLVTIAKDVKIQVEFNPAQVSAYRLIGYEKRMLRTQDFNNDKKDAGEIGAGHTVTAFYEIVPAGAADVRPVVDKLKYQAAVAPASYSEKGEHSKELLTLKLRYKQPDGDTSKLLEFPHTDSGGNYGRASGDFKFASAVAAFGMILRESEHKGGATIDTVLELAGEGKGADEGGWRAEFINLVKKSKTLASRTPPKEF